MAFFPPYKDISKALLLRSGLLQRNLTLHKIHDIESYGKTLLDLMQIQEILSEIIVEI